MDPHELTAAYALDALDSEEAAGYERHLGQCAECREQLAELNESATALAFGAVAPAPPERLRASILDAAAAERSNVVPLLRRRWVARGLAVAAAVAACIVVGLAVSLSRSSHDELRHHVGFPRRDRRDDHARLRPACGSPREDVRGLGDSGGASAAARSPLPRRQRA